MLIDIDKIEVGERLRSRLDPEKLRQLADDMERNGQLQEIVVAIKWGTNSRGTTIVERATLIAGYRRLEAAKMLGWTQIRCTRQLGGEVDTASDVDMLRIEYSENELRVNFTEMERIAFGVKIKERIAAAARERMLAGKKLDYDYDPNTGYKVWDDETVEAINDPVQNMEQGIDTSISDPTSISTEGIDTSITEPTSISTEGVENTISDPTPKLVEGIAELDRYTGGEINGFVAQKIGMSKEKFRQGEYVLKHGTEEQHSAINRGEASISGTFNELNPKPPKIDSPPPKPVVQRIMPEVPKEATNANTTNLPSFTMLSSADRIAELERQLSEANDRADTAERELAAALARVSELEDALRNAVEIK